MIKIEVVEARFRKGGHRWPFLLRRWRSRACDDLGEDHSGTVNGEQRPWGRLGLQHPEVPCCWGWSAEREGERGEVRSALQENALECAGRAFRPLLSHVGLLRALLSYPPSHWPTGNSMPVFRQPLSLLSLTSVGPLTNDWSLFWRSFKDKPLCWLKVEFFPQWHCGPLGSRFRELSRPSGVWTHSSCRFGRSHLSFLHPNYLLCPKQEVWGYLSGVRLRVSY